MQENKKKSKPIWTDPDNAPELTDTFFEQATLYEGKKIIRRGRPLKEKTKQAVSIRLSTEVLDYFRATGKGWQSRMEEILKDYVKTHPLTNP